MFACNPGGGSNGGRPCLASFEPQSGSGTGECGRVVNYYGTDGLTPGGGGGGNGYIPPLDDENRPIGTPLCEDCQTDYGYGFQKVVMVWF